MKKISLSAASAAADLQFPPEYTGPKCRSEHDKLRLHKAEEKRKRKMAKRAKERG